MRKGSEMKTRPCRTKFCRLSTGLLPILLGVLAMGGLLFGAQPASAQTCIQDVWKAHGNNQNLTCTAQDVTLSSATNIQISTGGSCDPTTGACRCFAGQTVTFTADFQMDLTADTRYDVGFYIATDSDPNHDGAKTGQCSATASLASNTTAGNFINLDAAPDVCGDITGAFGTDHNPLFVKAQISAQCPTASGQQLQLPFCTTWRQPGSNQVCLGTGNGTTTNDAFPGSPSKCNCGTLAIDIFAETPNITVTKDAVTPSVPETGGSATYSVKVKNNGSIAVTLTSLTDDQYGNITTTHAANASCTGSATPNVCQAVTATTCVADANTATCEVGGSLAAGAECSCTFTGTVPPGDFPGSFTDVVKGCANNITNPTPTCDTDDATVPYTDVPQPPSLTKTASSSQCQVDVTYNVVVTNSSAQDTLTLNTLTDDVYGNITQVQGNVISTTCGQSGTGKPGALPAVIAASGNYSCSFVGRITSCNTTVKDTVTGGATDDDGASYTPSDDATVVVTVGTP
jgi:hypothetical protein